MQFLKNTLRKLFNSNKIYESLLLLQILRCYWFHTKLLLLLLLFYDY